MTYLNGWTGPGTKNGKDVEYSRLVDWNALMHMDAYYASLPYNYNTDGNIREKYIDKEIKEREENWKNKVGNYIAKVEKMLLCDNGLVKYAFLDKNGDIITFKFDVDGKYDAE